MTLPAFIPSPDQGVWYLGSFPLRAYALFIILGIVVAVWLGERRWVARGGNKGFIGDVALWAVPFGIVGGRLYHVISDNQLYFGEGGAGFAAALRIWDGGLGIWGAILGGALGAWIAVRRKGVPLPPVGDAIAPGVVLAQAIGRLGNYFNQELFGAPTDLPWGLEIDPANRPLGYEQFETFHPTFLYEALWSVAVFLVLIWADRRFRMGHGRVFALYVLLYCVGRLWVEMLRIDTANHIFGLRLNVWTSILVGLGALLYIIISLRQAPGRETPAVLRGENPEESGPGEGGAKAEGDQSVAVDAEDGTGSGGGTEQEAETGGDSPGRRSESSHGAPEQFPVVGDK